ncbi:MAG: LysR family transcriptional regulator [Alphaproteobacteria bacterium]
MNWDKLRIFHAVAEAGSFTHAGETLKLSQSAVSRQVSALEDSLKVTLFHRHARGLRLTDQGRLLFETAREVLAKLTVAEAKLYESRVRPSGPLRITTTVGFGSIWLTPRITEFLDLYPDIAVTLLLDDRELDLAIGQADIAIRMAPPRQPELIQRRLLTVRFYVYASKGYLKKFGRPETPEDLDGHRLVIYEEAISRPPLPNARWLLEEGADADAPRRPALTLNTVYGVFRAVQGGLGIATLPDYLGETDHNLVRILPSLEGRSVEAYFVYPKGLRTAKRIAVFRDFLIRKVAEARA